jgi:aspartate racemase
MKKIGILGGMSWESTLSYYQSINRQIQQQLGGLHSAEVVIESVDFAQIEQLQRDGDWVQAGDYLASRAVNLQKAGAECVVIATNTMHIVAEAIQQAVEIPVLNIIDVTAQAVKQAGVQSVALLGTRFTMEADFYIDRLGHHGLQVLVPPQADRIIVHEVIYQELCRGKIQPESKAQYIRIIQQLQQQGAEGVILGCTEIGLLVAQSDIAVPLFDTTQLHTEAAVCWALSDSLRDNLQQP